MSQPFSPTDGTLSHAKLLVYRISEIMRARSEMLSNFPQSYQKQSNIKNRS